MSRIPQTAVLHALCVGALLALGGTAGVAASPTHQPNAPLGLPQTSRITYLSAFQSRGRVRYLDSLHVYDSGAVELLHIRKLAGRDTRTYHLKCISSSRVRRLATLVARAADRYGGLRNIAGPIGGRSRQTAWTSRSPLIVTLAGFPPLRHQLVRSALIALETLRVELWIQPTYSPNQAYPCLTAAR
jgi:hypothetical protein